ncbi:hypothetical protein CO154_02235 [Candidatus Pacearchaeota archaeon CG_4_9_14_3_um_filter_31_7]|nr:MAG: hypothetical protein COU55_00810 [Candidatus Pacearchaeota archaeon CG10_big_fil_rev_8_21_14_0_10_31_59]PIZ80004.1 MAG: hypothetical protein COX99_03450 [Candidatus Pacearchaeota archaeon CG_4_10_14_0_2_um_filter_31_10]PJA70577.1 MAG: hypothetical protein CO154_02235 [Candidatus Pacearchaeota archaeon CG_4_9_14_3_um_filter_31_7]
MLFLVYFMDVLFLRTKSKNKINFKQIDVKILPKKISLAATVQYSDSLADIKKFLESKDRKVEKVLQILGCSDIKAGKENAFLYIGSGIFHPLNVTLKTKKKVFVFNPLTDKTYELDKRDIERIEGIKKANKIKIIDAKNIGFIISLKPGQIAKERLDKVFLLKEKFEKEGKNCFLFLTETLNKEEFENFRIDFWINAGCPRITDDFYFDSDNRFSILNISDL